MHINRETVNKVINLASNEVKRKCRDYGLESLSSDEKILWLTWSALGFIQVNGIHGFLFRLDKDVPREDVVVAFIELGVEAPALEIVAAGEVLLKYLEQTTDEELSSDDLRRRFGRELTMIEQRIYGLDSKITDALFPIANRILGNVKRREK